MNMSFWNGPFLGDIRIFLSSRGCTLQETNISPKNAILKMIFLFPRWDMWIPWRVTFLISWYWCFSEGFGFVCGSRVLALAALFLRVVISYWTSCRISGGFSVANPKRNKEKILFCIPNKHTVPNICTIHLTNYLYIEDFYICSQQNMYHFSL